MAEKNNAAAGAVKTPWYARLFGFDPSVNKVRTEIIAGVTTFLTMAYILAVNPVFSVGTGGTILAIFAIRSIYTIFTRRATRTISPVVSGDTLIAFFARQALFAVLPILTIQHHANRISTTKHLHAATIG